MVFAGTAFVNAITDGKECIVKLVALTKSDTKNIEDVFMEKSYSILNQTLKTEESISTTSVSNETRWVSSTLVTDISIPIGTSTEEVTVPSRSIQISTSLSTNTVKDAISTSSIIGFSTFFDTSTEKSTLSSRSTQISTPQSTSSEKAMVTTSLTKISTPLNTSTEKENILEISTETIPFPHQKTSFSQSTSDDNSFNTIITKPSSSLFTTSTSFSYSKESTPTQSLHTSTPKSQFTENGNEGDIDYRELGGKSIELDSSELFNSEEVVVSSTIRPSVQAESSETLLKSLSSDEDQLKKYKSVFLANIIDRSDVRKHHTVQGDVSDHHDVTEQDPTGKNLIYSVCAASITTGIILVVVIVFVALRKNKKRMGKDEEKKDVATVAVYTTSIFHTPLPEPPSFENPSYITATDRNSWKNPIESIEVRDILPYPSRDCKTEFKTYLYDHPPSTGSYRASSNIDALSQYNNSRKLSFTGTTVLDPVYDEIPGNEEEYSVPKKSYRPVPREADNFNLYMNTCRSTKF
ncbi:uncharacterized threonine-rich GPI-anchored glycoprotein PJ4664.02-like isoform X2 [Sitophilus oryzae]|uniref:Uncharacterized threonine-rich GPI-anchored glycoprotein PJ4664.02-like isoform X2 n=1 Tax=Sitophilus oryzae TaxID=7048 RepID=A0A6J2XKU2_SITOR|nr:uncharacterized threonine-rich GPI-anchored glycoprotein PJ4664.02-like isoform X2 [Sitophilus oryzae]